jgi:hypothetical protein
VCVERERERRREGEGGGGECGTETEREKTETKKTRLFMLQSFGSTVAEAQMVRARKASVPPCVWKPE